MVSHLKKKIGCRARERARHVIRRWRETEKEEGKKKFSLRFSLSRTLTYESVFIGGVILVQFWEGEWKRVQGERRMKEK